MAQAVSMSFATTVYDLIAVLNAMLSAREVAIWPPQEVLKRATAFSARCTAERAIVKMDGAREVKRLLGWMM